MDIEDLIIDEPGTSPPSSKKWSSTVTEPELTESLIIFKPEIRYRIRYKKTGEFYQSDTGWLDIKKAKRYIENCILGVPIDWDDNNYPDVYTEENINDHFEIIKVETNIIDIIKI